MTERQKKYREYLQSDHWKRLRARALKRDGGKCVRCSTTEFLQVHHICYRGNPQETKIRDLETLCRMCYRKEHGLGPDSFDLLVRKVDLDLRFQRFPSLETQRELVRMAGDDRDYRHQVQAIFRQMATCRIWMRGDTVVKSWLAKGSEVSHRLWPWSEMKFIRLSKG